MIILFILLGPVSFGQIPKDELIVDTSVFPKEYVKLSINSDILLAGETLYYKIAVLTNANTKSQLSKIAYVSLRNDKDSIIFNHKLKLQNSNAYGDFFLPSSIKTGSYRLISYTNFSRNNVEDIFDEKVIYIINTFVNTSGSSIQSDTISMKLTNRQFAEFSTATNSEKSQQIITEKEMYGFREKVSISFQNIIGNEGDTYLLSVRKVNPITVFTSNLRNNKPIASTLFYLPELRGELISGKVVSKEDDKKLVANKVVSLTIPGKDFIFKLSKTDRNGRFFFSVLENYNSEKSFIQLYDSENEREKYKVIVDEKDIKLENKRDELIKLDSNLKDWLQNRSIQIQIENAYFDKKQDSLIAGERPIPFYDALGTVYLLDDYTRFPTVRETFIEIIKLAAVRGSGENTRLFVYNEYDPNGLGKFNGIPPLVLMDGLLIQNNNDLLSYNAKEIKSIRVINQPYRFGPNIYSGIIVVETNNKNFIPSISRNYIQEISLPPRVIDKNYFSPNYLNNNSYNRIPDYRVQLLWEPSFKIGNGEKEKTFFTSDVPGIYEIRLQGYSEMGIEKILKTYFQVKGK